MIYLDNAATSYPKPPAVIEAVRRCLEDGAGSAGRSAGGAALAAERTIHGARTAVAELLGAPDPRRVALFESATGALNAALKGWLKPGDHVVATALEHNAVARPLRHLESLGVELTRLPASACGELDPADLARAFRPHTRLVVAVHASNVLGIIQPVAELAALSHERDVPLLVDASQTAGALPWSLDELGADMLAFTGHKGLLGPQGTGGLYVREGLELVPHRHGGTGSQSERDVQPDFMPDRLESGTPNTPGLAGLAAAVAHLLERGVTAMRDHEARLTAFFMQELRAISGVDIYGPLDPGRRVGLVSVNVRDLDPAEVAFALESDHGIVTRPGLHCAPWAHEVAGTLQRGAVRFSVGPSTTQGELETALDALTQL